jgi:type I restriction enzyme M protein
VTDAESDVVLVDEGDEADETDAEPGLDIEPDEVVVEAEAGYIFDYISGRRVKATPEEVDAVQVFSRRLVEDFDYPKEYVQTRPQMRVRRRPSDNRRSFPVDIAVFRSAERIESNLWLIVECKKKNRKDGLEQLQLYLDMCPADIGVWFNGNEHVYLQKILHPDGQRTWKFLPNLPRFGQRIEDVGLYRRRDLRPPSNLRAVFRDLRNHLAGMTTGVTRDEPLAREIINILSARSSTSRRRDPVMWFSSVREWTRLRTRYRTEF